MAYQALARKWRPQSFRDILGQQTTVRTLQNAIEQKRVHHAYLFSGVRGVGKTTSARILAKALNCERGPSPEPCNECTICREITEGIDLDVREIDAATYSKAEDVREIREVLQFQPARDRYRIFIIDEVHSLSGQAWNALLKQIEEPPPHVVFMMATTEMHKVPATILSRVQQFALRKITQDELRSRLEEICRVEGIEAEGEALDLIARRGEGSVRDSLSILDQIIAFGGRSIRAEDVAAILGLSESGFFARIMGAVEEGDVSGLLELLDEAAESGRDFKILFRDLLGYVRNLLLAAGRAPERMLPLPPGELEALRQVAARFEYSELLRLINLLLKDDDLVNRSEQQRLAVEVALLKAATLPRLRSVEDALGGGVGQPPRLPRVGGTGGTTLPEAAEAAAPHPRRPGTAEPHRSAAKSAPSGDELPRFLAAIQPKRTAAGYLENAREVRIGEHEIVIEFGSEDKYQADYLAEAENIRFLASRAEEVLGRAITVKIHIAEAPEKQAPRNDAPAVDDPVVRAFQKHLGGEVVSRTPTRTRRTE